MNPSGKHVPESHRTPHHCTQRCDDVTSCALDPQLRLPPACDVSPFRGIKLPDQLFGYAISAKRYALYTRSGNDIHIEKASGHGLGYLFSPKERKKNEESDDDETPKWVMEAWEFL